MQKILTQLKKKFGRRPYSPYEQFLIQYPQFESTLSIDTLRNQDFKRLDDQNHIYLDFTGGQLFGESQIKQHYEWLCKTILGNPHSINPSAALAEKHIGNSRQKVLEYFNAENNYICIFTANASAAIKIVAECYPFSPKGRLLLTTDNHNSVNGIREFARAKECPFRYSFLNDDLQLNEQDLNDNLDKHSEKDKLFVYPAQSNVSGIKHDLNWIAKAQTKGWDVLLDAAAFVPSDKLDLTLYQPEFVAISFYKIFGYPTGLGALLVKKEAFNKLKKNSFAGGTITIVSVKGDGHYLENGPARFEEGTVNYLDIPAIKSGLEYIQKIGMGKIKTRVKCLTSYLISQLLTLRHSNGKPLIKIYGPNHYTKRGGTIAMNFYDPHGRLHDFFHIEEEAFKQNISIRTGCFCNPGVDETNHQLNTIRLKAYFEHKGPKDYFDLIDFIGQKRGAVRVSVGYITNFNDIQSFLDFCRTYLNKETN